MKKSNKLLLAGFLLLLLFITAIHITLYAKYKSGDYTVYSAEEDQMPVSVQAFPNILFVSVRNVPNATVRFSDVAQVEKDENYIRYVQKGDTLLITPKDSSARGGNGYPVAFHLPHNVTLSVFNSSLMFKQGKRNAANNPVIYLTKSEAFFSGSEGPLRFNNLKIVASDSSTAFFRGNTQINQLDVQLSNSAIEYPEGNLTGRLSIVTDSLSRIALQSKHLLKADIKTIAPE